MIGGFQLAYSFSLPAATTRTIRTMSTKSLGLDLDRPNDAFSTTTRNKAVPLYLYSKNKSTVQQPQEGEANQIVITKRRMEKREDDDKNKKPNDFIMWTRRNNNKTTSKTNSSSTTKTAGYVPSGLTPEEYQQIKQKEKLDLQSKKFALWGPRFKPSSAPMGDWMIDTKLWTRGFQSSMPNPKFWAGRNDDLSRDGRKEDVQQIGLVNVLLQLKQIGQRYGVAYIATLGTIQMIHVMMHLIKHSSAAATKLLPLRFSSFLAFILASFRSSMISTIMVTSSNTKLILVLKLFIAAFSARFFDANVLARNKEQRGWTSRTTLALWTAGNVSAAFLIIVIQGILLSMK